jgi:hypothetical protein
MKNNIIFAVFTVAVIVVVGLAYINFKKETPLVACPADAQMCSDGTSVGRTGPSCAFAPCPNVPSNKFEDELLSIDAPELNAVVTSPIQITGRAKGTFFFEGGFPILVTDDHGQIIGDGFATAEGDWATESLVPFTATILYAIPSGNDSKSGQLIFKNDNPSGLPENAIERPMPIVFGEVQ